MLHFFLVKPYAASLHGVSPFDCEKSKVPMDQNLQTHPVGDNAGERQACQTVKDHPWMNRAAKSTAMGGKNFAAACNWQGTYHSPLFIYKKFSYKIRRNWKGQETLSVIAFQSRGAGIVQIFQSDSGPHSTASGKGIFTPKRAWWTMMIEALRLRATSPSCGWKRRARQGAGIPGCVSEFFAACTTKVIFKESKAAKQFPLDEN